MYLAIYLNDLCKYSQCTASEFKNNVFHVLCNYGNLKPCEKYVQTKLYNDLFFHSGAVGV